MGSSPEMWDVSLHSTHNWKIYFTEMKGKWWRRGGVKERKDETSVEVSQGGWAEGRQEKDEGGVVFS